jgi:hypothetical protein
VVLPSLCCPECGRDQKKSQDDLLRIEFWFRDMRSCPFCGYTDRWFVTTVLGEIRSCGRCELPVFLRYHSYCENWYAPKDGDRFGRTRRLGTYHHPMCSPSTDSYDHVYRFYTSENELEEERRGPSLSRKRWFSFFA